MLLRHMPTGTIAISQPAHAWLAGDLARAWGGAAFAVPDPRDQVVLATSLHDIGWGDWEIAPMLDLATGLPLEYQNVPAEVHTRLWRKGVAQAAAYGAWPALLISRHGDAIYERTFDPARARPEAVQAVETFLEEQRGLQARLRRIIAAGADAPCDEAHLDLVKAFVVAIDTLSLHVCRGIDSTVTIEDVPDASGARTRLTLTPTVAGMAVAPWPFTAPAPLTVSVEGRRLDGRFASQYALDRALAAAESATIEVVLDAA
jgi:hypothetical protein